MTLNSSHVKSKHSSLKNILGHDPCPPNGQDFISTWRSLTDHNGRRTCLPQSRTSSLPASRSLFPMSSCSATGRQLFSRLVVLSWELPSLTKQTIYSWTIIIRLGSNFHNQLNLCEVKASNSKLGTKTSSDFWKNHKLLTKKEKKTN